jgi:hypothetical protein
MPYFISVLFGRSNVSRHLAMSSYFVVCARIHVHSFVYIYVLLIIAVFASPLYYSNN